MSIHFVIFHMKVSCFFKGIGFSYSDDEVVDEAMGGTDAQY
jgi:hypothetical protein